MSTETLPLPRTTLTEMVVAYRQSEADIRQAYAILVTAEQRLKAAFAEPDSYHFDLARRIERGSYAEPGDTMFEIKKNAWKLLVGKMGIRSAMSIKRAGELDKQLEDGKELPEISEENIMAMMETTLGQIVPMLEEAVKEVYDWLMPNSGWFKSKYKTNLKNERALGSKVILHAIDYGYSGKFKVNYHRQQNVTALDNVFAMLDGKGVVKTHYGPLTDAICASEDGTGSTDYFKFKCYGNNNLHLEFRRADLVDKLNAIAGGMNIPDRKAAA